MSVFTQDLAYNVSTIVCFQLASLIFDSICKLYIAIDIPLCGDEDCFGKLILPSACYRVGCLIGCKCNDLLDHRTDILQSGHSLDCFVEEVNVEYQPSSDVMLNLPCSATSKG